MLQDVFRIAASALSAESLRITLSAQNLANSDSIVTPDGGAYQRQEPVFETAPVDGAGDSQALGVRVAAVVRDARPPRMEYDPGNPLANSDGMIAKPAVDPIFELIDLMEATRVYQANLAAAQSAKSDMLAAVNSLSMV